MRGVDAKQEQYNLVSEVTNNNQQPSEMKKRRYIMQNKEK